MDFEINFLFLFINDKVILERGLNPLIIPIPTSLISWKYLRSTIRSLEGAFVINVLSVSVGLSCFKLYFLHINSKRFQ
jgi:hypothetical protein